MAAAVAVSFGVAASTPANAFGGWPKDQRLFEPAYGSSSHVGADVAQVIPVHSRKRYYRSRHRHHGYPRYRYRYYDRPAFGFHAYPRHRHRYYDPYYDDRYYYRRPGVGFGLTFGF
jgi:hypothetical protein